MVHYIMDEILVVKHADLPTKNLAVQIFDSVERMLQNVCSTAYHSDLAFCLQTFWSWMAWLDGLTELTLWRRLDFQMGSGLLSNAALLIGN